MRLWELGRYALENAWRSRLRTLLTVAGIAIASGALVSMVGFILGLREQVLTPIRMFDLFNNIEVNQTPSSPSLTDEMITRIEAIEGVEYAQPELRMSHVQLRRTEGTRELKSSIFGVPREAGMLAFSSHLLSAGRFFSLDDAEEIIISDGLVTKLGFTSAEEAISTEVVIVAGGLIVQNDKTFEREEREMKLKVVGVFAPPKFATSFTEDSALLPHEFMRNLPSSWMEFGLRQLRSRGGINKGYGRVIVRAESTSDVMQIEEQLREMKFETLSVMDRLKEIKKFFVFMEVLLLAVGTVALVVAGLGILNTLTMTVMERVQEIGIYKSIGASRGDIRWMFLVEAAAVGLMGGLCGLVLARVVSFVLGWAFNAYAASRDVAGPEAVFMFPLWLYAGAVLYSVIISVLSGLYPASKAANIDPIAALRRG